MRPILCHLGPLTIYSYGFLLGLSLIVGWFLVLGLCERDGLDRQRMGALYIATALSAFAGARLLYVATNLDRFSSLVDVLRVQQGGLVAYGGFLGGFVCAVVYCPLRRLPLLAWADCVVPAIGVGLALTRTGCFLFGCDFGAPTSLPWAVRFPAGSPAWNEQVAHGLLAATAERSLPVHPTQLYEVAIGALLLGAMLWTRRRRRFTGQVFVVFTLGYAVLRFLVETVRADEQRGAVGPLSTSQAIAIGSFALTAVLAIVLWRRARSAVVAPTGLPPTSAAPPVEGHAPVDEQAAAAGGEPRR